MLSRLSSFSGPFSKIFKPIGGFTLSGLILRYELSDIDSYPGTSSVFDLQSNSDSTLYNGPTYSSNGYLNFDGVNDYILTDTSLNPHLSPSNTSDVISFFVWIYPTDDGVIVTEQGNPPLNSVWHDSQIEIVSGVMKFGIWSGASSSYFSSSIPVSLFQWYYVGLTYDGSVLRGYINGQLAGSLNIVRTTPFNVNGDELNYAIAAGDITNLGDGSYSRMKLGAFHVYNIALSNQQVINNYNSTKNNYIYTEDLLIWIDANDSESFAGIGTSIADISGNGFTHSLVDGATWTTVDGLNCFDCTTGNKRIVVDGTGPTLSTTGYTYVVWAKLINDDTLFRTLIYTNSPRYTPITIPNDTNTLGYWDVSFKSSGFDLSSFVDVWTQYAIVGDNSSQTFYINGEQVGETISYGSGGNLHDGIGNNLSVSQPFGHIGNMMLYNTKLNLAQIKQNYDALKKHYNPSIVTDGLLLRLDANNSNSYSGTGSTWYDIAGTQQNMTLINSPTFVSGTVSYFDFNGANQYATGSGLTVGTSSYTKSVWFWIDVYTDNNIVSGFDGFGGHFIYMSGTTKIIVGHHNQPVSFGTYQSTGSISLNTWYNVSVAFNTTDGFKIYINGQLDSSHNMTFAHLGSGTTNISSYADNGGNYLNGRISKVYTYDRALTSGEILQNFKADRELFGI